MFNLIYLNEVINVIEYLLKILKVFQLHFMLHIVSHMSNLTWLYRILDPSYKESLDWRCNIHENI